MTDGIATYVGVDWASVTHYAFALDPEGGKLGYKGIETVEMRYEEHRVSADALLGEQVTAMRAPIARASWIAAVPTPLAPAKRWHGRGRS